MATKGVIITGLTEYSVRCLDCGEELTTKAHSKQEAARVFREKQGYRLKDQLWYCPMCWLAPSLNKMKTELEGLGCTVTIQHQTGK